jgi:alpha/beta superfamily hydrolase
LSGTVEPFYFPGEGGQLYGCLHRPAGGEAALKVAVIVPPLGHEYENAHRGLRVLAERLSRQGMAALRFDLSGLGDSAGDPSTVDPAAWDGDVDRALRAARRRSGASDIVLVGLRFGALLAARAASRRRPEGLVLWQPVPARPMVEEWKRLDAAEARAHGTEPEADRSLLGWSVTPNWLEGVGSYTFPEDNSDASALVLGGGGESFATSDLGSTPARSAAFWRHDLRDVLVPAEDIETIVSYLREL